MDTILNDWTRRKFVSILSGAGAAVLINPNVLWTSSEIDPRIAAIVAKTMGIDAHNHIDVPYLEAADSAFKIDLRGAMKKSGLSAICMTFSVDRPELRNPGEAYERYVNAMRSMDLVLQANNMQRSMKLTDLTSAFKKQQPTVIQSIEGAHFLEGKLDRLQEAHDKGLRHLTLLHDSDASEPLGDIFANPPKLGGLTTFGADVIRECERLGILVDLGHGSNEMVNSALKVTTKPVIISHTGLDSRVGKNASAAKFMIPRLISKEQAKIVADKGGVIGVWTHLADTALEYAGNVRAMVDAAGIDHVCIGTDTKLSGAKAARIGESTNQAWSDQEDGFFYAVV